MHVKKALIAAAAATLLVLGSSAPAFADHNAGAGLTKAAGGPSACYAGASIEGTPPVDISTKKWTTFRQGGNLHLVCYFTVPLFVPAPQGGIGDDKGDWHAPTTTTVTIGGAPRCLPPGVDAEQETWANGSPLPPPRSQTKIVAYKTSIVMYCSWPLNALL